MTHVIADDAEVSARTLGEVVRLLSGADSSIGQIPQNHSRQALEFATRLQPRPDGAYTLNGTKNYSTGALFAHWIPVFALAPDDSLTAAFFPHDAPGDGHPTGDADGAARRSRPQPRRTGAWDCSAAGGSDPADRACPPARKRTFSRTCQPCPEYKRLSIS